MPDLDERDDEPTPGVEAEPPPIESEALAEEDLAGLDDLAEAAAADLDGRLDAALRETFPASDPVAISPRPD